MSPSPHAPEGQSRRRRWLAAALAAAPTVGLTSTWLWILVLWLTGAQDEAVWRFALILLLAFAIWGVLVFIAGWLAAASAIGIARVPRWMARLGFVLGVASAVAMLTGQIPPA